MIYTKEEFKRLWESDANGGGITMEDVADCAVDWGLYVRPKCCRMDYVLYDVCKAAGVSKSELPDDPYSTDDEY